MTIEKLLVVVSDGLPGLLGGLMTVTYKMIGGKKYTVMGFLLSLCLAFLVGRLVGQFLPIGTPSRDGLIGIAGSVGFLIMQIIEERGPAMIVGRMGMPEKPK